MEKNPFVQAGAIDGGMDQLKDSCPSIPLCHILKATNDFDDALVIGVGGFCKVYKANIGGGATTTVVAIKRLRAKSKQGADEFWKEVKLRSKLRHTSLVSLIGYCNENQEMILVYEHIARATLANHLYKTSRCHLTWEQRLNICLHAARGLDYLHNGTLQGIIHGDVKSTNILLDEHLVAKVSDLGLSKSTTTHTTTHVNTVAKGTFGYLDPDYFFTRRLTKKSDVYAFGVVLLEVLCGRPAIDLIVLDEERILSHWAQMNIKEGTLDRIIDPSLSGDTTPDSLEYFAELANKCLHNQPKERPTMTEVVKSLQIALVSHERQGRSQGTIAKAWTLGGLLSRHRNPLLVPPNEIQKSSIPANGVGKPAKRTTTAFLATNSKAFDDFKARSKETFMIHQESIVKKEEGFINEHLPDHVFECQVQAGSEIESTSTYDRSGITQSLSSASEMENLTKSALSLDDSTKPRSLPDFDATENKAVKVYTSWGRGCWHSMEELEQGTTLEELGMDPENEGIISDLLRFVSDKEEFYKKAGKDWKMGYLLYDSPGTDRSSLIAAMANFLEFDIYHLDLTGLTSISELTNVLVSIRNRSLIAIKDFDKSAGKLPDFKTELTLSGLLKIIHGLLSSCGDERIIVLTTNHNRIGSVDAALLRSLNIDSYIHTSSPRPKALPDGGEIVLLDPSEQKPSVDFDATNNRAYQSDDLVSNSEEKNTREASRRQCMPESVPSLVDSTTRISLTDFDAPDNSAHLVMAYQSGPIVFNLEKKDMGEVLSRECLTKSVLSLDDSSKQKSLSDVAVTGKKSHIVRAYESGPVVSFSDDKNGGEALKRECITKSILGLEDLQQHSDGRGDDAAKSFCTIYDPGIHTADSLAWISFEVLKTLPTQEQPNDSVSLLSLGRLALEDCVQQEKSPDLPRVTQINRVERRVTKLPRYFGGLTAQFSSSSRWPIGLPDGGYIVLLDPLDQSTKHIEYVARADQCSPTLSLAEKKMVRKTLKRKCRTMSVIFEDNHQHFARRCEGADKSLGATRIFRKHGINQVSTVKRIKQRGIHQWPFFRQKWATRKGYSLGEGRPFEVSRLSMDEKLDSRLQLIHTSQFARSSPQALSLPDGGEIVRPTALSSSEFAATNNRAHLVGQDQNSSTASHYECKNTRETSDKQGLEDLEQHFGCKHKHAVKSLGVSGSMFKGTCRQHWVYWWPVRLKNNAKRICRQLAIDHETTAKRIRWQLGTHRWPFKQSAISLPDGGHILSLSEKKIGRKTLKRKCRSMSVLSLEDHKQHVDRRWEGAVKSHGTKRICRQLVIHRLSTAKRIRKQHGIHWWPFQRSFIGLPDGGHILPLSKKKILRKTLKRKCRGMSVLSLVDRQQHVDRRWEDPVKNIGAKRICRQLVIHRVSIAKRMCRQHGIYHRWPFQQDLATMKGYSLGDERPVEVISLYTHAKLVSRLQLIYISWLSRFSPRPSALAGGGEVGGPIALSLSESAATKNIAQRVGQDQSGSASDSENERTREQEDLEEIHASITSDDLRRLYGRMNRKDAAASLGVSESTFKRKCREYGIKRWPHVRKRKVGRPPDQHGEGNTSTARKTPSQYVQTRMGGEPVGQNHEASVFRRDFTEGPTALNTENGLIGSSSEWASQVKDQSTLSTPYPNHNALVFPQPHSMLSENRGGSIDWRNSFASQAEPFSDRHISGSSNLAFPTWSDQAAPSQHVEGQSMQSTVYPDHNAVHRFPEGHVCESINWNEHTNSLASQAEPFSDRHISGSIWRPPDQLEGQTTQFIAHQNPNALVFPQFQIASTQVLSENEDRRNSLASQVEAFFMGHVSESSNLAFPAYSDAAAPSQPLATILQTMPMTTHMIPQTGGFSGIFQLEGQLTQSTSHPNPNVVVPQVPQIASTQMLSENMASLENWEEFLSLEEETSWGGHVSGSVNLTGTTCCDPSPSQQPVTNRDMMPTTHVMSHLVAREDERSVTVKISYRDRTIKLFQVPLTSRIIEVKEEVKKRLKLEPSNFDFEYKDEDDGDWIFLGCDEDLTNHLQLFSNRVIRLLVVDSDASTKNICESCGSLKRKRQ